MIKKMLGLVLLMLFAFNVSAQNAPLPLNPEVKHGTLPNGLQYFILHNEQPKERANFYIAQKVGSTLETQEQLGLAHFLEHMAFNGTTHYPGKSMLNYLQSKGIRFGSDINAYTDFDETVYNINNVPTTDKALMDSVLLVLHDWSGEILLEEAEINAERGVIEEEWRSRNDANFRMLEKILPTLYQEYQYQQMPIGKMEIVRNFPPEVLRAYYKKWYRPDQQGIVIVGDFDADEMEKKVVDLFSKIPMPENAAERTYPTVSDNKEPIFAYYDDPEINYPTIRVNFKMEKTPFEMRNTVLGFVQDELVESLVAGLINNRLTEYSQKPECKYAGAGVYFGNYMVSKTKAAFGIGVVAKEGVPLLEAFDEAMAIVARACKTGFMESEVVRVRDEMIASFERANNEKKNTLNAVLASRLYRHFIDNTPNPGAEMELQIAQQVLPTIPVSAINELVSQLLTSENQVIVISQPRKEGLTVITEQEFMPHLTNALNAQYEAYVDEVITDPLIEKLPAPGKVKAEAAGKFGTTEFMLSNGVKVIIKPTDFKADEILLQAFKEGGIRGYAPEQAPEVQFASDLYEVSKLGKFNPNTLQKYLAGKRVGLSYAIGSVTNYLSGRSSVKDLPTLMELIYASFTDLNPDNETFTSFVDNKKTELKSDESNPNQIFINHIVAAQYANNPMYINPDMKMLEALSYEKGLALIKNSLANAADYTFVFTGNVDAATIKPLLEQYIATLPAQPKKTEVVKDLSSIDYAKGKVNDVFKQPMQAPSIMVVDFFTGTNVPYNVKNAYLVSLTGNLLQTIYTETLREEEGGTYSPGAAASLNPNNNQWLVLYQFQTNEAMKEKLMKRAYDEMLNLLNKGTDEAAFNKVKSAALKQFEIQERTNNYWSSNLVSYERGIDNITDAKAQIESITLDDINKFMKSLYNGQNRIEVVMEGVEAK